MKQKKTVLLVSLFHPELVRGGAQQVCYELFEGLAGDSDYRPVLLASVDDKYPALYKSGARITGFDGRPNEFLFLSRDYDYWWHRTQNFLAIETFSDFLQQIRPDVVHFHHFLSYGVELISLTRAVLPDAKIVFTFHEFLAICNANGHMVRTFDKSLCRRASQVRCHQCFPERSPEDFFVRKLWLQAHFENVDAFTCPSRFMLDRYADWGIDAAKLFYVTNGQQNYALSTDANIADVTSDEAPDGRNKFGFFGQMVDAKGLHILLRAVTLLRAEGFGDFVIEVNGDNLNYATSEVRGEIDQFMQTEAMRPYDKQHVRFNGSYEPRELASRMSRIDWCIVPSIWWEAFALVISEAWMFGKPVICSNVGAMADRVKDEVDGLHFEMGDPAALARAIKRAVTERGLWKRLSIAVPEPPARSDMVDGYRQVYEMPRDVRQLAGPSGVAAIEYDLTATIAPEGWLEATVNGLIIDAAGQPVEMTELTIEAAESVAPNEPVIGKALRDRVKATSAAGGLARYIKPALVAVAAKPPTARATRVRLGRRKDVPSKLAALPPPPRLTAVDASAIND